MVNSAEKFKEQDTERKGDVDAKNDLEQRVYAARTSLNQDLKEKVPQEDKVTAEEAIKETLSWLESNAEAKKDDIEEKQKEFEGKWFPIVTKAYQDSGAGHNDDDGDDDA